MEACKARKCVRTVVDVEISKTGQRGDVFITADFNLGPFFAKRKRLNVRSVYAGEDPVHIPSASGAQGMSGSAAMEQNVEQMTAAGER
jgi:hypothetical protein